MNCELCGKKIGKPTTVSIEGSTLQVCQGCSRHGKEVFKSGKVSFDQDKMLNRIQRKKEAYGSTRGMGDGEKVLALDYSDRIREARIGMSQTQEDLANSVNEKKSVIAKLEKGDLRPSDELIKKLESSLSIELMDEYQETTTISTSGKRALTLGDLIKEAK
ncbi:MAG: multiprotein bridging factor aMBF1 [Thermoplasmata archaeon]